MPLEVQSGQGTHFMSKLFVESLKELGIVHVVSSAYRPQSQDALECYHQKREVPLESPSLSPHELMFSAVRGPLILTKERWSGAVGPPPSVLQVVIDFKERQVQGLQMTRTYLTQAQSHVHFDPGGVYICCLSRVNHQCYSFDPGGLYIRCVPRTYHLYYMPFDPGGK